MLIPNCPKCNAILVENYNDDRYECPYCGLTLSGHAIRYPQRERTIPLKTQPALERVAC